MNKLVQRIKVPLYLNQLDRVEKAILGGELVKGEDLKLLKENLRRTFKSKYVVLTSNGFSAIFLTLQALDIREKEVVLPPMSTCFSMVNAVKSAGYTIRFTDVNEQSMSLYQINSDSIVLAPNHFGKISTWNTKKRNLFTIADACQSFLSSRKKRSTTDVTILSFYPTKIMNGIDGGAILTDNREIYLKAKELVYYGEQLEYKDSNAFNFRLNNINASFALATLESLDEIEKYLQYCYDVLTETLNRRGISFLKMNKNEVASRILLIFKDMSNAKSAFNYFIENKIDVSRELIFICPLVEQSNFPNAKRMVECSFSIPFHPLLTEDELKIITTVIKGLKWN